jgi:hypothetical protein
LSGDEVQVPLSQCPLSEGVCELRDARGQLLGRLKRIGAVWKFTAIGVTPDGELEPGGGPLTARHNMAFEQLDVAVISERLLGPG